MEKRNKHITINLTEKQMEYLKKIADAFDRKLSDAAYVLLLDGINENIATVCDGGSSGFKKLKYHSEY